MAFIALLNVNTLLTGISEQNKKKKIKSLQQIVEDDKRKANRGKGGGCKANGGKKGDKANGEKGQQMKRKWGEKVKGKKQKW